MTSSGGGTESSDLDAVTSSIGVALPLAALVALDLVVIVGNSLVVTAVFTHAKLRRSKTNMFVVSLAVADLMVGIAVLPFSSANEVLLSWPFGFTWCRMWLAVDVWLCTSSILNLCAISLDRFLAISRPFKYLSVMSTYRARFLIVSVWILAFIICFPPLVGWNEKQYIAGVADSSVISAIEENNTTFTSSNDSTTKLCTLNSDPGYVIYSALGSFWIPMIIMVGFYWRIYRTATQATADLRRGFITSCDCNGSKVPKTTRSGQTNERSSVDASAKSKTNNSFVGLRVHRGGGGGGKTKNAAVRGGSLTPSLNSLTGQRHSNGSINDVVDASPKRARAIDDAVITPRVSAPAATGPGRRSRFREPSIRQAKSEHDLPQIIVTSPASVSADADSSAQTPMTSRLRTLSESLSQLQADGKRVSPFARLHQQLRSLNREKKAAKTVGVIVGCFIVCWAPFFTVYLLGAFCNDCIPQTLFKIVFWLGYCNSAANPIIYGLCSRDFRYAFAKLLRCRCERRPVSVTTSSTTLRRHNSRLGTVLRSFRFQIATESRNKDISDSFS